MNLSLEEWGAIVYTLQVNYPADSMEFDLAMRIIDYVYKTTTEEVFNSWVEDYDIDI